MPGNRVYAMHTAYARLACCDLPSGDESVKPVQHRVVAIWPKGLENIYGQGYGRLLKNTPFRAQRLKTWLRLLTNALFYAV